MRIFFKLANIFALFTFLISLLVELPVFAIVSAIVLLFTLYVGFIEQGDLEKYKNPLIACAILMFPTSPLYTILVLIGVSKMSYKRGKKIDPVVSRVNNMLNLGMFLIVLSALIFIVSSWNNLSGNIVSALIFALSLLFLLLSYFIKDKLELPGVFKVHYYISMLLSFVAYLAIGHLNVLGSFFSVTGKGSSLYFSSLLFFVALISTGLLYQFKNENFKYAIYSSLILSIAFLFHFLIKDVSIIILLFTFIDLTLSFLDLKKREDDIVFTISYLMPIIFVMFIDYFGSNIILILTAFLLVFNLLYPVFAKKDLRNLRVISPFIYAILLMFTVTFFENIKFDNVVVFLVMHVLYFCILFIKNFRKDMPTLLITTVITNFGLFMLYLFNVYGVTFRGLYVAISMIIVNALSYLIFKKKELNFESYFAPIKIMLVIYAIITYLNNYVLVDNLYLASILAVTYFIVNIFIKNKDIVKFNLLIVIFIMLLSLFVERNFILLSGAFTLILFISFMHLIKFLKVEKHIIYLFYILLLMNVYVLFENINLIEPVRHLFTISFVLLMSIINRNSDIDSINYAFLILPINSLLLNNVTGVTYLLVIKSYLFFIIVNFSNYFGSKNKENIIMISTILLLASSLGTNILNTFFVFVISTILLFTNKVKYSMKIGIAFMLINLIYNYKELFLSLPLWLYILTLGLGIVFIVTFLEFRRMKK